MADYILLRSLIRQYDEPMEDLEAALHINTLKDRYKELEQYAQAPDFWSDTERAQKMTDTLL